MAPNLLQNLSAHSLQVILMLSGLKLRLFFFLNLIRRSISVWFRYAGRMRPDGSRITFGCIYLIILAGAWGVHRASSIAKFYESAVENAR